MKRRKWVPSSQKEIVLEQVLRSFRVSEIEYSIGYPAEQRVCMEKQSDRYHVYVMERGLKFDESYHNTEFEAHLEMLHQLSSSNSEYQAMCHAYRRKCAISRHLKPTDTNDVSGKVNGAKDDSVFFVGDTVRVHMPSQEKQGERTRIFEGTVVAKKTSGEVNTVTVRRITNGIAVQKTFAINSPASAIIEVLHKSKHHGKHGRTNRGRSTQMGKRKMGK